MSLFQRAHDMLAAKTNKALDAAGKPDEMLDLSVLGLIDLTLVSVHRASLPSHGRLPGVKMPRIRGVLTPDGVIITAGTRGWPVQG